MFDEDLMNADDTNLELDKIHEDLWNYLSKISEDEGEDWKIESFSHLRNLLSKETSILLDLFKPLDELTKENLKSDFKRKGLFLYREWGKTRKKEFMTSYYENEYFRAVYARNRFLNSAISFIQALILRIIPANPNVEQFLINEVSRVISIGVGPGSDIAGFLAFRHCRNSTDEENFTSKPIVYYTMDLCQHWNEYIQKLDQAWCHKYRSSLWFKPLRFGNKSSLDVLPDADMIVFSFANTVNMNLDIWPELARRYSFVLILDGIKESMLYSDELSSYSKLRLNEKNFVYFSFKNQQVDKLGTSNQQQQQQQQEQQHDQDKEQLQERKLSAEVKVDSDIEINNLVDDTVNTVLSDGE